MAKDLKVQVGAPGETQDEKVVVSGSKVNLHLHEVEKHKVTCPYCIKSNGGIGYAIVTVTRKAGAAQVQGLRDPHRCNFCKRYFKVRMQMRLDGVPFTRMADLADNVRHKELTNGG